MKKKGAGMVMAIMLVAIFGWVAIVGLVIKPNFQTGAFLSLAGGGTIGLVIVYLMRRWWFKGITMAMGLDPLRVTGHKEYPLGTRYVTGKTPYRYACAGEDLKSDTLVEPGLSGRLVIGEPLPEGGEINELIYGDVRPAAQVDKHGRGILGWPLVNVKKRHYCWLQEPPLGSKFEKEGANAIIRRGNDNG